MSPNTRFSPPVCPLLVGRHAMDPPPVRIGTSASQPPSHPHNGPASSCSAVALQEPFVPGRWSWRSAVGTCPAVPTTRPYSFTRQSSGIVGGTTTRPARQWRAACGQVPGAAEPTPYCCAQSERSGAVHALLVETTDPRGTPRSVRSLRRLSMLPWCQRRLAWSSSPTAFSQRSRVQDASSRLTRPNTSPSNPARASWVWR
jgi:hypothetical protein